jgi:hypothetical protein
MLLLVASTASNGESFSDMLTEGVHALQVAGAVLITLLSRAVAQPADRTGRIRLVRA